MGYQERMQEIEERRRALREARSIVLDQFILDREKRVQWLVQFMDIEDELEELARWPGGGKLIAGGDSQEEMRKNGSEKTPVKKNAAKKVLLKMTKAHKIALRLTN